MTVVVALRGRGAGLAARWAGLQPWVHALVVYLASRIVAFAVVDRTSRFQALSMWTGPHPGYLGMVSLWDGEWYHRIALYGYPATLPHDLAGHVTQSSWAFYPLYPAVVRSVMTVTGAGWPLAATSVGLVCGAGAVVVMRSVVEPLAGASTALWTVAFFCFFPAAPVLQLAYTEALASLVLLACLLALQRRSYLTAALLCLMVGLTRPIAVPLAVVVVWHAVRRWRQRRSQPLPTRQAAALWVTVGAAAASALLWPAVAAVATGDVRAYPETMAAWRVSRSVTPLRPWWDMSQLVLGPWVGPVTLALVLAALLWWVTGPAGRLIAGDLRTWVLAYSAYLLVVLDPYTSLPRYLLLLFPLGTLLAAVSSSRAYRLAVLVAFTAGQVVWVVWLWRFVPPSDLPP